MSALSRCDFVPASWLEGEGEPTACDGCAAPASTKSPRWLRLIVAGRYQIFFCPDCIKRWHEELATERHSIMRPPSPSSAPPDGSVYVEPAKHLPIPKEMSDTRPPPRASEEASVRKI